MLYIFYFFTKLPEAESFYNEVLAKEKYLGVANTVYGLLYFVAVGHEDPKTLEELYNLGYDDYQKAQKYRSFVSTESSNKPDDIAGLIKFLKTPKPHDVHRF